jgi:hypothetical protein
MMAKRPIGIEVMSCGRAQFASLATETSREVAWSLAPVSRSFLDQCAIGLGDATLEIVCESIESALPKSAVSGNPSIGLFHGLGFERQNMVAPFSTSLEQAGPFQHAQVFCYRRPGNPQRPGQLAGSRLTAAEAFENHPSRRISDRGECRTQASGSRLGCHRDRIAIPTSI